MSDGLVHTNVPNSESIRSSVGKPGPVHEEVYNMIVEIARAVVEDTLPQMGTVIGRQAGEVLVTLDDEADDRTIGVPKRKGIRYQNGDRVKISTTKGGDKQIDGIVSTTGKDGRDPAVDSDQVFAGGIKRINLDSRSVGSAELDAGVVETDHLGTSTRDYINGAYTAASGALGAAGVAQGTANSAVNSISTLSGTVGGLATDVHNASGDAGRAQTRADNAWDKADDAQGRAATLERTVGNAPSSTDFSSLQARVTKLERQVKRLGGSDSGT